MVIKYAVYHFYLINLLDANNFWKKIESFHTQNMFDPFWYSPYDNLNNKIKMLWDGFMCAAFLF